MANKTLKTRFQENFFHTLAVLYVFLFWARVAYRESSRSDWYSNQNANFEGAFVLSLANVAVFFTQVFLEAPYIKLVRRGFPKVLEGEYTQPVTSGAGLKANLLESVNRNFLAGVEFSFTVQAAIYLAKMLSFGILGKNLDAPAKTAITFCALLPAYLTLRALIYSSVTTLVNKHAQSKTAAAITNSAKRRLLPPTQGSPKSVGATATGPQPVTYSGTTTEPAALEAAAAPATPAPVTFAENYQRFATNNLALLAAVSVAIACQYSTSEFVTSYGKDSNWQLDTVLFLSLTAFVVAFFSPIQHASAKIKEKHGLAGLALFAETTWVAVTAGITIHAALTA